MALNINTNIGALGAAAAATSVNKSMETAMERLSTGLRINTAADDAAGVAIASRLTSEIRGTNQAIRNAMDGQALIDTAEGAHNEITNILQRMRELAVQAANDTNDASDRANLNAEFKALTKEIDRIAGATTWAGQTLLNGTGAGSGNATFNFQVGQKTGSVDTIAVNIGAMSTAALGRTDVKAAGSAATATAATGATATTAGGAVGTSTSTTHVLTLAAATGAASGATAANFSVTLNGTTVVTALSAGITATAAAAAVKTSIEANVSNVTVAASGAALTFTFTDEQSSFDISTRTKATDMITAMDTAIGNVNTQRANLGAVSNRLDSTVNNLTNISTNLEAGRARIQDADFAAESTNLAKSQILQQASMAMLAQANAAKQGVLQLLQG